MRTLELWNAYTREEVHDIFSPNTSYQAGRGSWGMSGIVTLPHGEADWAFFVTIGSSQAGHDFDESISDEGVLTWQSQPSQRLRNPQIQKFIQHDYRLHTIHLFLRPARQLAYTYCGTLAYLSHDSEREAPVYFQWQLMDWPPPAGLDDVLGVRPRSQQPDEEVGRTGGTGTLQKVDPPSVLKRGGRGTEHFVNKKQVTQPDKDARNAELGLAGERLVLRHEAETLRRAGRADLLDKIVHVAVVEGDSAGYDIRSWNADGSTRFIEVKTTRGSASTAFFVSPNEVEFSRNHPDEYVLMRVFNYTVRTDSAQYFELRGPLSERFQLDISEYRASLLPEIH